MTEELNNMGYTNVNENGDFYILFNMPNGYIYKGEYVPPCINLKMLNSREYVTVDLTEEPIVNNISCENQLCDVTCPYCQSSQEQLYRESGTECNFSPYFNSHDNFVYLPGINNNKEGFQNPTTTSEIDRLRKLRQNEISNLQSNNTPKSLSPGITSGAKLTGIGNLNNVEGGIGYYKDSKEIEEMGNAMGYSTKVINTLINIWTRYRELQRTQLASNNNWVVRNNKKTGEQLLELNNSDQKIELRIGKVPTNILSEVQYMRDLWSQIQNRQQYLKHTDCSICNIQCNPDTRTLNSDEVCLDNHPCSNCPVCGKTNQVALQLQKCPEITNQAALVGTGAATERKKLRTKYVKKLKSIQASEREELCGDKDIGTAGYLCLQKIQNETAKKYPYLCTPAKWEKDGFPCNNKSDDDCINIGGCLEKCRCYNSNKKNSDCNKCLMTLDGLKAS